MATIRQRLDALEAARKQQDAHRAARKPMSDMECAARLAALGPAYAHAIANPHHTNADAYALHVWPKVADILARAEQRKDAAA